MFLLFFRLHFTGSLHNYEEVVEAEVGYILCDSTKIVFFGQNGRRMFICRFMKGDRFLYQPKALDKSNPSALHARVSKCSF